MKHLYLVSIIFFLSLSCKNNENTSTNKIKSDQTEQIADVDSETIELDSIEMDVESSSKFDTIIDAINIEKFDLAYVAENKLYLYSVEQEREIEFPFAGNIFNCIFTKDLSKMYFLVSNSDNNTFLCKAEFKEQETVITTIADLESEINNFTTDTYSEKGRLLIDKDSLFIECGYQWGMFCFDSALVYHINANKMREKIQNPIYNYYYHKKVDYSIPEIEEKITQDSVKGGEQLIYNNTIFLTAGADYVFHPESFGYEYTVLPNKRGILFSYLSDFGDLAHGPLYYSSLDGKFNLLLLDDYLGLDNTDLHWIDNGNYVVRFDPCNYEESEYNLQLLNTETNTFINIASNADFVTVFE